MDNYLPTKRPLQQSRPLKPSKHPRLASLPDRDATSSTAPASNESESVDDNQLLPGYDTNGGYVRQFARVATLEAARTKMLQAKRDFLSATKELNSELRKPDDDDLPWAPRMAVHLSESERETRKTKAEEKAMACCLLEGDKILTSHGRSNLSAMFHDENMEIMSPDIYWLYMNLVTDGKERTEVVWLKRKLREFVDMGGELFSGTIEGSFVRETVGMKERPLDRHGMLKARKENTGSWEPLYSSSGSSD